MSSCICFTCLGHRSITGSSTRRPTAAVNSLLSGVGIRFMLTSMARNFMNFAPVGIILVVMIGVGLAEQAGLMTALIKKIVQVTPRKAVTWILVTVGVLASFAADAYLVLIPLGAVTMGDALEHADLGTIPLILGFITVTGVVDLLIVGVIPKGALLAPIFVPLFMKLRVAPETVLAAYRVGDSPPNAVTPLMPYFALVVTFAQRYDKQAGIGRV